MFKSTAKREKHGTLLPNDPERCVNKHPVHLRAPPDYREGVWDRSPFSQVTERHHQKANRAVSWTLGAPGNQGRALLLVKETLVGEEACLTVNWGATGGEFAERGG